MKTPPIWQSSTNHIYYTVQMALQKSNIKWIYEQSSCTAVGSWKV